jgi:hypothetical protein
MHNTQVAKANCFAALRPPSRTSSTVGRSAKTGGYTKGAKDELTPPRPINSLLLVTTIAITWWPDAQYASSLSELFYCFEAPKPHPQHGKPPFEVLVQDTSSRDGRAGGAPLAPRRAPGAPKYMEGACQWHSGNSTKLLVLVLWRSQDAQDAKSTTSRGAAFRSPLLICIIAILPKPEAVRRELRNKEELTPPRHDKGPTSARLAPLTPFYCHYLVARCTIRK